MAEISIGEVATRAGLAASAIRYYEAEGLIAKADRKRNRRVYPEKILDRLALIGLAKSAGFTMAEIKRLLSAFGRKATPSQRWRALTESKMEELDARIAEAQRMQGVLRTIMRCECPSLDDCCQAIGRE